MKKQNYVVIGGQYAQVDYGSAPTLLGAKRIAGRHVEHWDNWEGVHVPAIYRIEDTVEGVDFWGQWSRLLPPDRQVEPVAVASYRAGRVTWTDPREMIAE